MEYDHNGYMYILESSIKLKVCEDQIIESHGHLTYLNGTLLIHSGFKWDGATCAIDTPDFIRGSCVHDALYSLIAAGKLPPSYRSIADKVLYNLCREDGMTLLRASYVYAAVRLFGGKHVSNS